MTGKQDTFTKEEISSTNEFLSIYPVGQAIKPLAGGGVDVADHGHRAPRKRLACRYTLKMFLLQTGRRRSPRREVGVIVQKTDEGHARRGPGDPPGRRRSRRTCPSSTPLPPSCQGRAVPGAGSGTWRALGQPGCADGQERRARRHGQHRARWSMPITRPLAQTSCGPRVIRVVPSPWLSWIAGINYSRRSQ